MACDRQVSAGPCGVGAARLGMEAGPLVLSCGCYHTARRAVLLCQGELKVGS